MTVANMAKHSTKTPSADQQGCAASSAPGGRLLYVTDGSFGPAGRLGPPTAFESEEGDGHEQEGDDQQGHLERWISCVDAQLKGMG